MQYVLTGFTHDTGFRVFAFEGVGEDRVRTQYEVRADLVLVRKYGIRIQELPLLCCGILERREGTDPRRNFIYAEADMRVQADARSDLAAAQKRKPPRKPPSENLGAAWRAPQP